MDASVAGGRRGLPGGNEAIFVVCPANPHTEKKAICHVLEDVTHRKDSLFYADITLN